LCSDGLSNYIENDELGRIMADVAPEALPGRLVDLANERGGAERCLHAAGPADAGIQRWPSCDHRRRPR
jgi:hypothetical protein